MRLAWRVIELSSTYSRDDLKVRRPLEPPIVWQLCAVQRLKRGQPRCLRHTNHDLTRSGAVVHAGFNVSLSEGPMTELFEWKGLVNSLHGGPLIVLLAQDIDMVTMSDEVFTFSHASFDEVCRSHCHEVSRMLSPAWRPPVPCVFPILDPILLPCGTRHGTLSLSGRAPAHSPIQIGAALSSPRST